MGVSKIIINGVSKIDVTQTTVTADALAEGITALGANGELITGTASHSWMGDNPELLSTVYMLDTTLDKTSFDEWTASTTAGTVKESEDCTAVKLNLTDYEYYLEWTWCIDLHQIDGATMAAMPDRTYGEFYQVVHQRPYGLANFETMNDAYNYCTAMFTSSAYNIYYNKSGTHTWTSTLYGVYCTNTAGGLSSTSSLTPNLTPKSPAITARCNASYFATARKAEIDSANSTIKVVGKLYRVDRDSSPIKNMYMNAVRLYSHPL